MIRCPLFGWALFGWALFGWSLFGWALSGCDFVRACRSSAPNDRARSGPVPVAFADVRFERELFVVELTVALLAHQREVVDIGPAFGGCIEGNDVMRFAASMVGVAEHARLVSGDEGKALSSGRGAAGTTQPKRLTVFVCRQDGERAVAQDPFEF